MISHSATETRRIAADIARKISGLPAAGGPVIIALEGELGAGKTTFVQGFAQALGITDKVKSPTFLLIKEYPLGGGSFFHIDCYRVATYEELLPLEIERILKEPGNIVLIEWPERIAPILPESRVRVHIDHIGEKERRISISGQ